ncbi:MAG: hypothetical protein AAGA72_05245 [Pseudomonadota bacterium]
MQTYLNGRVTVSSLAAPSEEDLRVLNALSEEDRRALIDEALERGRNSGISDRTVDDAFESALKRYRQSQSHRDHAV